MFSAEILIHLGRGIAWVAENFPEDPRLGNRLLLVGAALIGAFWFLAHSPQWMDSTFILQVLSLIAGIICMVLGLFVFFRRAFWRNQEKTWCRLAKPGPEPPSEQFCSRLRT